jgi:pimeloyl-ACP methyl ester carboxylesterase
VTYREHRCSEEVIRRLGATLIFPGDHRRRLASAAAPLPRCGPFTKTGGDQVRGIGVAVVAAVLAGGLAGCGQAVAGAAPEVDWAACPGAPQGHPVRCATIPVPVDWATGTGRVDLHVSRLSAADPDRRIGVLMFNPGGPGTGAAGYLRTPEYAKQYLGPELLARFDVVGVDPRGVAGSQPVDCALPAHDPTVDRFPTDAAGVRTLTDANAAFANSCAERSGPLAAHLDTGSVARDLDAVRAALGAERISFLGVSYGSMLGRAYAELFPNRLRALALDAIVDRSLPAEWLAVDDAAAVQDGVEHFAAWCAAEPSCALDVPGVLPEILASADRGELLADGRALTATEASAGVNAFLQSPQLYPQLATALTAARQHDGTALAATGMAAADPDGYRAYRAIICQDLDTTAFTRHLPELVHRVQRAGPALRGYSEFWDIASGCAGWPVPAAWQPHPWPTADLPPTLLVSGAHDVATPREWAERTRAQLPDSALLRWDGAGHSAWQLNNPCATAATIDYLISAQLPPEPARC